MMKPRNQTSPAQAVEDHDLPNCKLAPQIERLIDESLNRNSSFELRSSRRYLDFEIFILLPHPGWPVNTASTRRKATHRALRSRVKAIDFWRLVQMENQCEVLW